MIEIVLKTNKDVENICRWSRPIIDSAKKIDFPYHEAKMMFKEEKLGLYFKTINDSIAHFDAFIEREESLNLSLASFDVNLESGMVEGFHVASTADELSRVRLITLLVHDNTISKLITKFMSVMVFITYYRYEVEKTEKIIAHTVRKKKRKSPSKTRTIYTRVYTISSSLTEGIKAPRRPCDHAFTVRGHYRHLSNGKTIWVREHQKCTDRGTLQDKQLIAKMPSKAI